MPMDGLGELIHALGAMASQGGDGDNLTAYWTDVGI
jgi:hypothetical protein